MFTMGKNSSHRQKHRQKSHSQSHTESSVTPPLHGHPLVTTTDSVWVDSQEKFHEICVELRKNGIFAFDTEFIGEDSYYPNTCLIQVATSRNIALIDPFVVQDLSELHSLICDPKVITVVHAGSQDFEPVVRQSGSTPSSVFDTQIALGFVGFPWPLSLTKSIDTILHHDVGGHFTFSQWDARPLSNRQVHYASDDVRYLLAIHDFLEKRLQELDRTEWAWEECSKLTSPDAYQFNIKQAVKKICGNKTPRKKELQRIQAIAVLRNEVARKLDLPPKDVVPNECVLQLSRQPLDSIEKLANLRGFPKHIAKQFGTRIIQALQNAPELTPVKLRTTQKIESDPHMRQELDGMWSLFNAYCISNYLSVGLVTNRPTFTDWYLALRQGKPKEDSPLHIGWRLSFTTQFTQLIESKSSLTFSFDKQREVPMVST